TLGARQRLITSASAGTGCSAKNRSSASSHASHSGGSAFGGSEFGGSAFGDIVPSRSAHRRSRSARGTSRNTPADQNGAQPQSADTPSTSRYRDTGTETRSTNRPPAQS